MTQPENTSFISEFRKIIWPIEAHEVKKFLPMAGIMFCILFNYSMLRSIKDGFVVTLIGAEAISFLKTYLVLPSAVLAIIIYSKLCNIMSQQKVFYTITTFFLIYFALFAFVFYPNQAVLHPNPEIIENLSANYPNFKWFIRIGGKWSLASFYVMAELWGAMMLSLLFWQFANQITKTEEAKRFYSMFGMLGNIGLLLTAYVLNTYLGGSGAEEAVADESKFKPVITFALVSGLVIIFLYNWINRNVLTDPTLYDPSIKKVKKEKVKLSIEESFKVIFTSKYLGLIALLVLAYGISINLVEGVWKAKANQLYPTPAEFTSFMGTFQGLQGITAILFMIIGSNILRRVSWKTAAMFTPLMILVTGLAFFSFIFFDSTIGMYVTGLFSSTPLAIAVMIGTAQNVLSKATKYSLFDSTKEMAYIPLDNELKTKGKAAVDVVGGRLGKSGGGFITSTFFFLLPSYGFEEATPYFAGVFFVIVILWLFAVKGLSKQYEYQKTEHSY